MDIIIRKNSPLYILKGSQQITQAITPNQEVNYFVYIASYGSVLIAYIYDHCTNNSFYHVKTLGVSKDVLVKVDTTLYQNILSCMIDEHVPVSG